MLRTRRLRLLLEVTLLGGLLVSCREPKLPLPPTGFHRPEFEHAERVDYPPPPARIEEIDLGAHRDDGCVWVDGSWRWNGRRWVWEPGAWVLPPAGCYFAPAESFWQPSESGPGVLYYRNPAWYPDSTSGPQSAPCPPVRHCG